MDTKLDADIALARKLYIRASIVGDAREFETARERFAMLKADASSKATCNRTVVVATLSSALCSDSLLSNGTFVMDKGKKRSYDSAVLSLEQQHVRESQ